MELHITSLQELDDAAQKVLALTATRKVLTMVGDLGAGKTTFSQAIARQLGVHELVTSPTFSIINQYQYTDNGVTKLLYHIDLYRLNTLQEALDIGIEDYLFDGNYCIIEWPQLIESILPDDVVKINIEIMGDTARKIVVL